MTYPTDAIGDLLDYADGRGYFASTATVQYGTPTRGSFGDETQLWDDLPGHVDLPAHLSPSFASLELATPERTIATDARTVTLKGYRPAITTNHRLVADGKDWNILATMHGGEKAFTKLLVSEVH